MNDSAAMLAAALRERLAIVADETSRLDNPALHIDRLRAVSKKIEAAQTQLDEPVHPQLRHFLERGSYTKALEFLEPIRDKEAP